MECSGSCAVMTLGRGDMVHPSSLGLPRATGYSRSAPTSRHQHLVCTDAGQSRPQRRSQGSGTAQTAQHRASTSRSASTSSAQTQVKRGRGVAARALAAFKPHSIVRRHGIVRQITFSRGIAAGSSHGIVWCESDPVMAAQLPTTRQCDTGTPRSDAGSMDRT